MLKIDNHRKCPRLGNLLIQGGPLQSPEAGESPAFPGDFCGRHAQFNILHFSCKWGTQPKCLLIWVPREKKPWGWQYQFWLCAPAFGSRASLAFLPCRLLHYFRGRHHLEEIMYNENMRRSQLLMLFDKFRSVLVVTSHEDPVISVFQSLLKWLCWQRKGTCYTLHTDSLKDA